MAFITLDFETYFRSRSTRDLKSYSLKSLTYENYIFHPEFDPYMVGIKINRDPTHFYHGGEVREKLTQIFTPGNDHTLLCHNTVFDGAILHWYFNLKAARYWCTQSMSNALWNQGSASLAAIAERLWPDDKTKRKGKELVSADGVKYADMTPEVIRAVGGYCIKDVDLTFEAFAEMIKFFPRGELDVMNLCNRIFIEPTFLLDVPRCQTYVDKLIREKDEAVARVQVPEKLLGSDKQFASWVQTKTGIIIPEIPSPTIKNPNNKKLALAKNDLEFLKIRNDYPEHANLWDARILVKSNGERNRGARLISHVQPDGTIAVPLKYSAAHTHRFGGTNKVNFQNFKRKSELRRSLLAPEGKNVYVADLSNIEGRVLAWFAEETELLADFANGADIYSEFASDVYGRKIDRKRILVNEETGEETKPDELEGFVGKVCILGLGYGMGPPTLQRTFAQGALGGPQLFFELDRCVDIVYNKYRKKYARIAASWKTADRIIREMANPQMEPFKWRCLTIEHRRIRLPNGLYLNYPGLRYYERDGESGFEYWEGSFWKSIWGGTLIENIIQALSRIILTTMMLEIDKELIAKYNGLVALTVHDEIVSIADESRPQEIMDMILGIMSRCPDWCDDGSLVLAAEGGYDKCYSK